METKAKESSTLRKQKKVAPSSNSHTTHRRQGSPNSAIPGSTDKKDKITVSSKPIPNYLKPTFSSRPESSLKNVKKSTTGHEDTAQKHVLLRRRSFDRPPSASRIQKSLISPDPKDRAVAVRSTPLSSKTTSSSPKPGLDRTSTSPKPVKSQPSAARTIKRSSSLSRTTNHPPPKNIESHASVSLKDPISLDVTTQTVDLETEQESNKESLVHEAEELANIELESEDVLVPFDVPKMENKDIDAIDQSQVKNDQEDENLKVSDICTVSEGKSVSQATQVEETEQELHEEDGENGNHENETEENHSGDEGSNSHPEEGIADHEADKNEVGENENENEKAVDEQNHEYVTSCNEGSEELKSKEGQDHVVEGKPEAEKRQVTSKKESPAAYNDVIEETKNKLLEKRKNKVKALVGAFETVIDYESAASR